MSLLAVLSVAPLAWGQQGTADAIVVKIAATNLPSSVTLSTPGGNGFPGQNLTLPLTLSLLDATAPCSFQIDLTFDSTKLSFVSASGMSSTGVSDGIVRLSGANPNGVASGVVGYVTFAMAPSFGTAATPVSFTHCESADRLNNPLSTGCASGSVAPMSCDVTGDGATGATDVRAVMNEALGIAPAVHDLNQDGVVNVADIQRVALAAMGSGCVY